MAAHPLGREVVDGADDLAGARDRRIALDLRDPEVGEQDTAVGREQDVARLHVPVQHTGGVRSAQRAQHPQPDPCGLGRFEAPLLLDLVGQRVALHQLHDDPRPVVVFQHVMDGDDGRVVDPGGGPRLGVGPGEQPGPLALGDVQRGCQLLDRDGAVQHLIVGTPNPAHATAADGFDKPVAAREEQALHLIHVSPQWS